MTCMKFHEKLRELMARKRIHRDDLIKAIGIGRSTAYRYVNGEVQPRLDHAAQISRFFGVTVDYLAKEELIDPARDGLSPDDREIIRMAKTLGYDLARKRLMAIPASNPSVTQATPRKGQS